MGVASSVLASTDTPFGDCSMTPALGKLERVDLRDAWTTESGEFTDPIRDGDWPNQNAWMADMLSRFDKVFRERVTKLDPEDWLPDQPTIEPVPVPVT
jgi:hypothetical protein